MWWLRRMATVQVPSFFARSSARSIARTVSQTPGQAHAVPCDGGGKVRDHARRSRLRHATFFQIVQIRREQLQAVRGVAQQVALDQDLGDDFRFVGFESCLVEQR